MTETKRQIVLLLYFFHEHDILKATPQRVPIVETADVLKMEENVIIVQALYITKSYKSTPLPDIS